MENMTAVEEGAVYEDMRWSTVIDLKNKLVVHIACMSLNYDVDYTRCDPDGLPFLIIAQQRITRTRRMTDKEFEKYVKEFGMKIEIDMRVHHTEEKDILKQE